VIKGIIFDKDGTVFDFNATWGTWTQGMLMSEVGDDPVLFTTLATALGYDVDNQRFHPGSIVIAATAGEVADTILKVLPDRDKTALLSRMNAAASEVQQIEAVPLISFFTELQASNFCLGIATNDAEAPAIRHLERAGVKDHFDFIAGYDSGHGAKPGPGQLLAFCSQTGLRPADCVMVGDSTHDLEAGRAAGMRTIGVLTGPAPAQELAPMADVVLPTIGDIPAWVQAQNEA
jgi:phosphoglycolate phosphatase